MMKIRIKFRKYGTMKFIGHLDVMRYFQKAIRRSEVNIRYSEGFSPHQIMSFAAPLGVGITSKGEYVDIEVLDTENSKKMIDRLNAVMSEGFEILEYKQPSGAVVHTLVFGHHGDDPKVIVALFRDSEGDWFTTSNVLDTYWNLLTGKEMCEHDAKMMVEEMVYDHFADEKRYYEEICEELDMEN